MKQENQVQVTEFHTESPLPTDHDTTAPPRIRNWFEVNHAQAAIESLLFALRFRTRLTDSEKSLMDLLTPEHAIAFLVHDREYLHPESLELFPMALIESSVGEGGDAIFTQRYRPTAGDGTEYFKVSTARISKAGQPELILGVLGPDQFALSGETDNFGQIAGQFRQAWNDTEEAAATVLSQLDANNPTLVINRASGRIVAASDSFSDLCGTSRQELVDSEYSAISAKISGAAVGYGWKLKNLALSGLHLCLATLIPPSGHSRVSEDQSRSTEFLIHAMRNKIAAITTASSFLDSVQPKVAGDQPDAGMPGLILSEAEELDRHLERLNCLLNYESRPKGPAHIARNLERAIELTREHFHDAARIDMELASSQRTLETLPAGLVLFLEAIFRSHLGHQHSVSQTMVTLDEESAATIMQIATRTGRGDEKEEFDENWRRYARSLAGQLGVTIHQEAPPMVRSLRTTIRIPVDGNQDTKREN